MLYIYILSKDQNLHTCLGTDFYGKEYSFAELKKIEKKQKVLSSTLPPTPVKAEKGKHACFHIVDSTDSTDSTELQQAAADGVVVYGLKGA